jgi:hypothetical protein
MLLKVVGTIERIAHALRVGESRESIADVLDQSAHELREDLFKGSIRV